MNVMKMNDFNLITYVDGRMSPQETIQFEAMLQASPSAQSVVKKLNDVTPAQIREAFDTTLSQPISPQFAKKIMESKLTLPDNSRARYLSASIAAVLIFFAGLGLGYLYRSHSQDTLLAQVPMAEWITAVIDYQVLYGRETLNRPDASDSEIEATAQRLSVLLGREVIIPDLHSAGVMFKRGQPLELRDQIIAQLAYLPVTGKPIAYCITRTDLADSAPVANEAKGITYYHWRKNGLAYLLAGEASVQTLQELITLIRAQTI